MQDRLSCPQRLLIKVDEGAQNACPVQGGGTAHVFTCRQEECSARVPLHDLHHHFGAKWKVTVRVRIGLVLCHLLHCTQH